MMGRMPKAARTLGSLLVSLALFACTQSPAKQASPTSSPTASPTASPAPTTAQPHPISIQALIQKAYDGRDLELGTVLARTSEYTRYFVTYKSGTLTISGVMNVPAGRGPFPALVLAHGYIDPDVYVNGQGMRREQDWLARAGYIVLHTDYRNHATSTNEKDFEMRLRLGYVEDVLNAIMAIKRSGLPYVDPERIGVVGRSMGGGVAFGAAVARPDLVGGLVVFAPVSTDHVDNFNRWMRRVPSSDRRRLAERIADAYGSPEENPDFWRNVSSVNFLDRIAVPVVIHHGTSDDSVPIAWSEKTTAALRAAGKDVRYFVYEGEEHAFGPLWPRSMRRTVDYFDAIFAD